jgi:capsular polysaccharide biosynthesis protein
MMATKRAQGTQVRPQTKLLDATDIMVAGHGVVIAMFVFLPRCAVVVELSSQAPHCWMNTRAAKTLMPSQLQTVSVSC